MEIKVEYIVLAILGALVLYFKRKANNSAVDAVQGETKGQDKILKENQDQVKAKIDEVTKRDDSGMSPEDRAKRWD